MGLQGQGSQGLGPRLSSWLDKSTYERCGGDQAATCPEFVGYDAIAWTSLWLIAAVTLKRTLGIDQRLGMQVTEAEKACLNERQHVKRDCHHARRSGDARHTCCRQYGST